MVQYFVAYAVRDADNREIKMAVAVLGITGLVNLDEVSAFLLGEEKAAAKSLDVAARMAKIAYQQFNRL